MVMGRWVLCFDLDFVVRDGMVPVVDFLFPRIRMDSSDTLDGGEGAFELRIGAFRRSRSRICEEAAYHDYRGSGEEAESKG